MADGDSRDTQKNLIDADRIQRFLEEAAPIILESRTLDDQRLDSVLVIADRLGVNRAELWRELRWLTRRGVITDAPWKRLAPPPSQEPPPIAESPPPLPETHRAPDPGHADQVISEPQPVAPPNLGAASPPRSEPIRVKPAKPKKKGKQPGQLRPPLTDKVGTEPGPIDSVGEPGSELQPTALPMEAFADWVDQQLLRYSSALLAVDDENGLVGVGVHRHHLADVLARHIVREVATRSGKRLERDLQGASEHSTVGSTSISREDQATLQLFFDRVAPILALHRGINTQSRILMSAVAQQLGLTEEQFDQAIAQLQQSSSGSSDQDPHQVERLESYRRYLRRAIAQLPGGIITFQTQNRLAEAGEYFHGVARDLIVPTIKEVASESGAHFISKQQAIDHVASLIADVWKRGATVTGETRVRIYAEGTQWGLTPMDIESLLRERNRQRREEAAQERRRVRRLVMLTAATMLTVLGFLGYLFRPQLPETSRAGTTGTEQPTSKPRRTFAKQRTRRDSELRIALANVRSRLPDKRDLLDRINTPLPSARGNAYQRLVEDCLASSDDPTVLTVMQPLLVRLFASENAAATANQLSGALLKSVHEMEEQPPQDRDAISSMFWACQTAVLMWKDPTLSDERVQELAKMIESAVAKPLDRLQEVKVLERACLAALTERLYGVLTKAAVDQPERVQRLYFQLLDLSETVLGDETRDQLDASLLAAVLPNLGEDWSDFDAVIERLAASRDPDAVLKLLKIYEETVDPLMQSYLAALLAERIGASGSPPSRKQLIAEVRRELGIPDMREQLRRWSDLIERAGGALDDVPIDGTRPEVLLEKSVDLTYFATAACALARGASGLAAYDALETEGTPKLDASIGPWSPSRPPLDPSSRDDPRTFVEQHIAALVREKRVVARRIQFLEMIANLAGEVSDVSPATGQSLAQYLVRRKPDKQERDRAREVAPKLVSWNALRLGLADYLSDDVVIDEQMVELYAALFGDEFDMASEADRLTLRRQIMLQAANDLGVPDVPLPGKHVVFQQATEAITELLRQQASLLGVPSEQYQAAERPSLVLIPLIHHLASQLNRETVPISDRQLLDRLPSQLKALQYLANDDLQYTVRLQYLLARLVALRIAENRKDRATETRQLMTRLDQRSGQLKNILEQYWHVNATVLDLWLLYEPVAKEPS